MSKEKFIDHSFNKASLKLIETCNAILEEYRAQGYRLSLRQLYYQLVARDYIENSIKSYKRTGDLVSNARLAGLLDWGMIEDRGREVHTNSHWDSPAEIIRAAAQGFKIDRWEGQSNYIEVMVEKDALSGILLPVCRQMDVRFTANKGYSSSSAMYYTAYRLLGAHRAGCNIHIIYLGDHDPSGIDMTRDITERLELFTRDRISLDVHRLALNYDQVEMWSPPENPAKESDSRFAAYQEKFGDSSWELDAVEPATLASLVRDQISELIDLEQWGLIEKREAGMRKELNGFAVGYENRPKGQDYAKLLAVAPKLFEALMAAELAQMADDPDTDASAIVDALEKMDAQDRWYDGADLHYWADDLRKDVLSELTDEDADDDDDEQEGDGDDDD